MAFRRGSLNMDLTNIRGAIFDVDGVLHVSMTAIPGAAELLAELNERQFPYRLLTNTTTASRATLAANLREIGMPIIDDHLITTPVATAAYVHRRFPGVACYLLVKG